MSWYAIDAIDDALDATRAFLFPFDRGRWLRLLVIVFFLGGGGGNGLNWLGDPSTLGRMPTDGGAPSTGGMPSAAPSMADSVVLAVVLAAVVLALAFVVAAHVMRFVLVDALRTDVVRVRGPFKQRLGKGVRLLLFNAGVGLLLVGLFVAAAAGLYAAGFVPSVDRLGLAGLAVIVAAVVGFWLVVAVFYHFTNELVVPVMIAVDTGVIAAWRRFWGELAAAPWQWTVYLVVRFFLNLAVAIVAGIATLVGGGIVLVVGALVGVGVASAYGGLSAALSSTGGVVALGVVAVITLVALVVLVVLPVRVCVRTYLMSYVLSVLGDADDELALLADFGGDESGTAAVTTAAPGEGEPEPTDDDTDEAPDASDAEPGEGDDSKLDDSEPDVTDADADDGTDESDDTGGFQFLGGEETDDGTDEEDDEPDSNGNR